VKTEPFVSVVTPFYNTADYLRECIESVLAQTYSNFEYVLVDNQSTDGSAAIAAEYAARDKRIRVVRNQTFVGQVANYNGALRQSAKDADYVKLVQADDCLFPECLERMIAVGEAHPSAAIISSYYLNGSHVCGSGVDWPIECIPGRKAARLHLLEGKFLFGTPTTLMYRGSLVAKREPFYSESRLHEDTELCHEVMSGADLGFVHQVLSFNRVGNSGILTAIDSFHWQILDFYTTLLAVGSLSLSAQELATRLRSVRSEYFTLLGESVLLGREAAFWDYHRKGLATVGEKLPTRLALAPQIARAILKTIVRPAWFRAERARLRHLRKKDTKHVPRPRLLRPQSVAATQANA
jgi:glycosyltransferase involved in cell wall biosynthesis